MIRDTATKLSDLFRPITMGLQNPTRSFAAATQECHPRVGDIDSIENVQNRREQSPRFCTKPRVRWVVEPTVDERLSFEVNA